MFFDPHIASLRIESAPGVMQVPPDDPRGIFLGHVARVMDAATGQQTWADLLSAMFKGVEIEACHIASNGDCHLFLDGAYRSRARGDKRTVHYPKDWVIRLDPDLDQILFVDSCCEHPTGMVGSQKVTFLGLCKGAVQWIRYDREREQLITYSHTNVSVHRTDEHRACYYETVEDWKSRVWYPDE